MFIFITMFDATPPTLLFFFFFFNDTATTEIYTLSLHDALPISMLSLKRRDAGRNMVIFRNSWSLDASTIPAFERRSEEHTSELQSQSNLVCRLLLEKKKKNTIQSRFESRKSRIPFNRRQ